MEHQKTEGDQNTLAIYERVIPDQQKKLSPEYKDVEDQFSKISIIGEKEGSLFSTRRPKDFFAGTSSGLKSAGKGILAGVSTIIAAPVIGA